ncbi:MAG: UDPglucose 6-dehydrogenase [Moorella sp. (in: firmicutes)]|uniref:UDP-glucose 6-dehydrogenase n=1 Tax=Neomoorella thermoacetica TaxID=1525 RepID=A0A1J5NAB5_NEOTH|nr:UDPglucose 6-dehydrogenase [Moorella sp. (in: firmicutes)]OIQ55518.1 UDP-glucose 6-dehydrogenase TuaD [Moorella thermoacetica]
MQLCITGAGYVGLVTAAVLADLGHEVMVVEVDPYRLAVLERGNVPFSEPDLAPLVRNNIKKGRLDFTADLVAGAAAAEVIIIAVGTPPRQDGVPDMTAFNSVVKVLPSLPPRRRVVAVKSTVPVGTGDALDAFLQQNSLPGQWQVVANPEFLRQGSAVKDTREADRIVIGASDPEAAHVLIKLYAPLNRPVLVVDRCSAEMIKYAANAFLATKISFINEMAGLCELMGADIGAVAQGIGMDHRIGPAFLKAGIGFGGSCLPKDLAALLALGTSLERPLPLTRAVVQVNEEQKLLLARYLEFLIGDLQERRIALLGLTFKPGTDDIRSAPALELLAYLLQRGSRVTAYDPEERARRQVARSFPAVTVCDDPYRAAAAAEAILLLTEWPEFSRLDWRRLRHLVKRALVLDGRNFLEGPQVEEHGFLYVGIGQKNYSLRRAGEICRGRDFLAPGPVPAGQAAAL